MTDDFMERLSNARTAHGGTPLDDLWAEAKDRIEALTAEYEEAMECNEQFFVDNEFLKKQVTALTAERASLAMSCLSADGEAQRAWDAQKAAEAERDRLREALGAFVAHYPKGINPDLDAACFAARAALKGETP